MQITNDMITYGGIGAALITLLFRYLGWLALPFLDQKKPVAPPASPTQVIYGQSPPAAISPAAYDSMALDKLYRVTLTPEQEAK